MAGFVLVPCADGLLLPLRVQLTNLTGFTECRAASSTNAASRLEHMRLCAYVSLPTLPEAEGEARAATTRPTVSCIVGAWSRIPI